MRVTHPDSTDYTFPSVRTDSSEFTEQTFQRKKKGDAGITKTLRIAARLEAISLPYKQKTNIKTHVQI